jgi:hypothetical protein
MSLFSWKTCHRTCFLFFNYFLSPCLKCSPKKRLSRETCLDFEFSKKNLSVSLFFCRQVPEAGSQLDRLINLFQVATDALLEMEKAMKRDGILLNDKQLACARINSPEGQNYLAGSKFKIRLYFELYFYHNIFYQLLKVLLSDGVRREFRVCESLDNDVSRPTSVWQNLQHDGGRFGHASDLRRVAQHRQSGRARRRREDEDAAGAPQRSDARLPAAPPAHPRRLPADRPAGPDRRHDGHQLVRADRHAEGIRRLLRNHLSRRRQSALQIQSEKNFGPQGGAIPRIFLLPLVGRILNF